ncbi:kinase-like domain-containing protein, partial [Tanacetum coccineum]
MKTWPGLENRADPGHYEPGMSNPVSKLSSRSLEGSLSPHVGNLSFLSYLSLWNNSFQGTIPHELGRLSRLRILYLDNNKFSGVIPTNLSGCSKLEELWLAKNNLSGSIPKEMSLVSDWMWFYLPVGKLAKKCSAVFTSEIHGYSIRRLLSPHVGKPQPSSFSGVIPTNLSGCSNLEVLSLARNKLVGSIPNEMSLHLELSRLVIHDNKLTGGIPPFLGNITSMEVFSARRNPFGGSIPDTLGLWKSLREFYCSDCNLYGSIPHSIFNLSLLVNFSLPGNHLTGSLPSEIGNQLPYLEFLQLRDNELTGVLPPSLSNCSKLGYLEMSSNNFSGMLTIDFSKLRDIYSIRLHHNNFHGRGEDDDMRGLLPISIGKIPTTIGKLQKLQLLSLHSNQFSGTMPDAIGNLSLLTELYLYSNKLEGHIPSSLGNCKELNGINLSYNRLNGKIPKQLLQLPSLTIGLELSQNSLSGSIPPEIKDLKLLSALYLSYNNLSGNITSSLGECVSLTTLNLRGNQFQGIIPSSLSSLRGLELLNKVPVVGVFANASAFSVLGNNRLCGGLVTLQLPKCKEKGSKKKRFPFFIFVIVIVPTLLITLCCVYLLCKKKRNSQPSQSSGNERFLKVSYNELLKATDGFSTANLIGEGGSSSVYKGILDYDDGRFVAVKVLHLQNRGAHKSFLAECEAWRNIRHRNVLKIITSCSSTDFQGNDFKALVYEYMSNGSVHDWLHSSANTSRLNLLQRVNILRDVANALDYLHNRCQTTIVHGDLKPSNILLDDDMVAHVGDFGLARLLGADLNQNSSTGVKGTIGYAPPEYGIGSEMTSSGDVYSFGILLLEVMTGKKPTDGMFNEGLSLHKYAYMTLPDR